MTSKALTVDQYIQDLPDERREVFLQLRNTISKNLPEGFEQCISYGMVGFVVPHSLYPKGYHCAPELPLPFVSIASQKNFIAIYHMGLYANQKLMEWFVNEYPKHSKLKLDMGKSCIRFKKLDQIPFELIGELMTKISPNDWINMYENAFKKA